MKISIGSDNAAFELKKILIKHITELGHEVTDVGIASPEDPTNYPEIGEKVALAVKEQGYDRGILVCGTGIGMSIVANKVPGVCAALCHDTFSAERAIKSNNAQILTMGARVIGPELAKKITTTWLESVFTPGPSSPKIQMVADLDAKYKK